MRRIALLCGLASLAAASVHAQQATRLPEVVITPSRISQAVVDALPSTRLITRDDIDRSGATDLGSLLYGLTSIDVARNGPLGSATSLFLRGADSRQVLLLVDGLPMSRADFGTASWQNLPLDQIERIEIVRGNLSSVWGSQAVGGVVQIVTRRATGTQFSVAAGSQGTRRASLAAGTQWGADEQATRLSTSLSYQRTGGYSARDADVDASANPDRDGSRQIGGNARLEQTWARGQRTSVQWMGSATRVAYDSFTPGEDDRLTTWLDTLGLQSRHALGEAFELGVDLGQTRERFRDATGFDPEGRNRVQTGGVQLQWAAGEAHTLQVGAEGKREFFEGATPPGKERRTDSGRLGWVGQFLRDSVPLEVQLNARHDRSSAFGSANTGLAAFAFEVVTGLKLSAQFSSAFSTPSFLDEASADPATPLRAERALQREFALQWMQGDVRLRAAYFNQRQRNRVAFDPITFQASNIARARNRGVELIGEAQVDRGHLTLEATFQNPIDLDTGARLKRRARESIVTQYQHDFGAWQASAGLRYTGDRQDTDPVTFGDAVNGERTTLDLGVTVPLAAQWRLVGRIGNATGSKQPEVLGFTPLPRTWLLQLEGRL